MGLRLCVRHARSGEHGHSCACSRFARLRPNPAPRVQRPPMVMVMMSPSLLRMASSTSPFWAMDTQKLYELICGAAGGGGLGGRAARGKGPFGGGRGRVAAARWRQQPSSLCTTLGSIQPAKVFSVLGPMGTPSPHSVLLRQQGSRAGQRSHARSSPIAHTLLPPSRARCRTATAAALPPRMHMRADALGVITGGPNPSAAHLYAPSRFSASARLPSATRKGELSTNTPNRRTPPRPATSSTTGVAVEHCTGSAGARRMRP